MPRRRTVLARMAGQKLCRPQFVRIAVLLGLGFFARPRSLIECRKRAIGRRPFDAALHRLMMHAKSFPDREDRGFSAHSRSAFG